MTEDLEEVNFERTDRVRKCSFCKEVHNSDYFAHLFPSQLICLNQPSRWHGGNFWHVWWPTLGDKLCHSRELTKTWLILLHQWSIWNVMLFAQIHSIIYQQSQVKISCIKTAQKKSGEIFETNWNAQWTEIN